MKKIYAGLYSYRGWIVERMEAGHWNIKPENEDFWTDSFDTKWECKERIDRYIRES